MTKKKTLEELLAAAKALPTRSSNIWNPEKPGEAVAGVITQMRFLPGKGKDEETGKRLRYMSLTIETVNGDDLVVNCGTMLEQDLIQQDAKLGDTVAIVFQGETKTGSGNVMGIYACIVEKAG